MEPKWLDDKEFEEELKKVSRIWDSFSKEGLSQGQAQKRGITSSELDYIFIRGDGWSIACSSSDYEECYRLWDNNWTTLLGRYRND